ncbi:MAG: RNA chaperone Hfq [Sphingomicrobium sp.]
MAAKHASLQDQFLNAVRRSHQPVSMFVMKGVRLQGLISGFDAYAVELRRDGKSQLVYKHSIATVMPAGELDGLELVQPDDDPRASLQDRFLSAAARQGEALTVFLVNGVMLQGEVAAFDQFSILLRRGRLSQLVYKHAISTIQPEGTLRSVPEESRATEGAD